MPSGDNKILKFNQYQISRKISSVTYADLESFIKRIDGCKSNFKKQSTTKIGEHISCGYSMSTRWAFNGKENKYDIYRG